LASAMTERGVIRQRGVLFVRCGSRIACCAWNDAPQGSPRRRTRVVSCRAPFVRAQIAARIRAVARAPPLDGGHGGLLPPKCAAYSGCDGHKAESIEADCRPHRPIPRAAALVGSATASAHGWHRHTAIIARSRTAMPMVTWRRSGVVEEPLGHRASDGHR
jgi:hypothetical protein